MSTLLQIDTDGELAAAEAEARRLREAAESKVRQLHGARELRIRELQGRLFALKQQRDSLPRLERPDPNDDPHVTELREAWNAALRAIEEHGANVRYAPSSQRMKEGWFAAVENERRRLREVARVADRNYSDAVRSKNDEQHRQYEAARAQVDAEEIEILRNIAAVEAELNHLTARKS